MHQTLPWIIALAVLLVVAAFLAFWFTRPSRRAETTLPADWDLAARPVFSVDERRAYRQLRDALPHYIVLAKLPLVRFCQPNHTGDVRYWFDLLGNIHVTFAICSGNGRVLAVIDLDSATPVPRRTQLIKQNMLAACRIRYVRCTVDHLPSLAELQALIPPPAARQPQMSQPVAAPPVTAKAATTASGPARATPAAPVATAQDPTPPAKPAPASVAPRRRKERNALWQDSGLFQDSFFGIDNLRDAGPSTGFGQLLPENPRSRLGSGTPSGLPMPGETGDSTFGGKSGPPYPPNR